MSEINGVWGKKTPARIPRESQGASGQQQIGGRASRGHLAEDRMVISPVRIIGTLAQPIIHPRSEKK
jgi:hypothetical protein